MRQPCELILARVGTMPKAFWRLTIKGSKSYMHIDLSDQEFSDLLSTRIVQTTRFIQLPKDRDKPETKKP